MAINRPSSIRHLIIATPRYKRRATKILFLFRIEWHSPPNGAIETLPPSRNFDFLSRNSIDDRPFFAPRGVVHLDSKEGTADRYGGAEVRAYVETFLSTILYLFLVLSFLFFLLLFFTRISTHTHTQENGQRRYTRDAGRKIFARFRKHLETVCLLEQLVRFERGRILRGNMNREFPLRNRLFSSRRRLTIRTLPPPRPRESNVNPSLCIYALLSCFIIRQI